MLARLVCFFCLISLTACSSFKDSYIKFLGGEDNSEPPAELLEFDSRARISELWDADAGSGTDEQYLKLVPVYADNRIFVADAEGEITAYDSNTGKRLWDEDTDTEITGGLGAGDSIILMGTGEAEVLALTNDSGEILWSSKVSSEVLSTPQINNNIVVARTIDGKILGIDAASGKRIWTYDRTVPALTLRGTSSPIISDNLVLAGLDGGRLAAIELTTGKLVWETRVALGSGRTELERMVDIDAEPVVKDGVVYVATFQGRVAAIDLNSGEIQWTRDIPSHAGLCVDDTAVYITDDSSHVWALDRFTGTSIWKQEKLRARAVTGPANVGSLVVVADLEGYLHWLDKSTGEFVARNRVSKAQIITTPLTVDGIVYAYATDGTLGAYTYDNLQKATAVAELNPEDVAEDSSTEGEKEESGGFWGFFSSDEDEATDSDPE